MKNNHMLLCGDYEIKHPISVSATSFLNRYSSSRFYKPGLLRFLGNLDLVHSSI